MGKNGAGVYGMERFKVILVAGNQNMVILFLLAHILDKISGYKWHITGQNKVIQGAGYQ